MTPEMVQFLFIAFGLWSVAITVKAARALQAQRPYEFALWDGGMIRAGKRLTRTGAQLKLGLCSALALCCAVGATGERRASMAALGIALLSLVNDFASTEKD